MAKKPFDPEAFALRVLRAKFSERTYLPRIQAYQQAGRAFGLIGCALCPKEVIREHTQLDHKIPVVPISGHDDSFRGIAHRLYCQVDGLQVLCMECHKLKTKEEAGQRAVYRKQKKKDIA